MIGSHLHERAYAGPFFAFLGLLFFGQAVAGLGDGYAHWALAEPRYWVYPLQLAVCAALLWRWRGCIVFGPLRGAGTAAVAGLIALLLWVFPQQFLGFPARTDGFRPDFFGSEGLPYWLNVAGRFARLVVIVPLVEEIFWRGFLLRYLVREDFRAVPFGTFTWQSFAITSGAFCLEHQPADWPAALLTGALYNVVAYRTRSLAACVITHAVTNLGLGIWVMRTGQWGFW